MCLRSHFLPFWLQRQAHCPSGSAAELASTRKLAMYSALEAQYDFQPVAVETLGPLIESAFEFLNNLGQKIGDNTGDDRSTSFLFQPISVLFQRFKFSAVLLNDSFMLEHHLD